MKPLLVLTVLCILFTGCKKDEEEELGPLSGMIEAKVFELGIATVDEVADEFYFDLFSNLETITDECTTTSTTIHSFFSLPKVVGKVDLDFDLFSLDGETITLFDPETFTNVIVSDGYVEIVEIRGNEVLVKIDADYDSDNFLKGEFTATICN